MKPFNKNNHKDKSGFIYVMKNEGSRNNRYKVGVTKREPHIRAKELSTSYAEDFVVLYYKKMKDVYRAERKIFQLLSEHRPSDNKEVIDVYDLDIIISTINYVADSQVVFD